MPDRCDHVRFEVLQTDDSLRAARALQARRYLEMGYVQPHDPMATVEDEWCEVSTYFGARSPSGAIVGVARLIPYTSSGLPVLRDLELNAAGREWLEHADRSRLAEFSALAVAPEADAQGQVSSRLYRAMYQHCAVRSGRTAWLAAISVRVKRLMSRRLDSQFHVLGNPVWYRGALTEPVLFDTEAQYHHYALEGPKWREWFCEGLEIDLTHTPPRFVAGAGNHVPPFEVGEPAAVPDPAVLGHTT